MLDPGADLDLVQRVLQGEDAAFDRFFDAYHPRLFRFALRRLNGDRAAAEDVAQATLLRAIDALPGWRGEASLLTWMFTLCRRELSRQWRGARIASRIVRIEESGEARAALESLVADTAQEPDRAIARDERRVAIQVALDYLPADYATALEARYLRDQTVQQIADWLGRSPKATESLLSRARGMFREALQQLYGADAAALLGE